MKFPALKTSMMLFCVAQALNSYDAVGDDGVRLSSPIVWGDTQVSGDQFGISVDLDRNQAIVGAPLGDNAPTSGATYVLDAGTGELLALLLSPNKGANDFGRSVAIHNDVAVVGAPGHDAFERNVGAAYVFDVTTSEYLRDLNASDTARDNYFGHSVSVSGNTAIVGAWGHGDPDYESGAAYLFDVTSGQRLFKLTASDSQWFDHFGYAVDIDGHTAIVGARGDDDLGFGSGAAYVFDARTGEQVLKLTAADGQGGDHFGSSVAVSGNFAVVGALKDDERPNTPGSAYVFDVRTGEQLGQLAAPDGEPVDEFGYSVDVHGNLAVVGAWRDSHAGDLEGSAYLFDVESGRMLSKLTAFDAQSFDHFGTAVALDAGKAIIGAPGLTDGYGAAYVHTVNVLLPGDADQDFDFDQLDLVQVQVAAKYLTGQIASWAEGDWNGAPGGEPGNSPAGDGMFNQLDIIAALAPGHYLTGPYAAVRTNGQTSDAQTSVVYDPGSGEIAVDAAAGTELTSINIDSAAGIFTGSVAQNLGGSFDNDGDINIFKATFGGSFGSLSFGNVAQIGLSKEFVLGDLTVVGSLAGGGDIGNVDLVYVPEPTSAMLLTFGLVIRLTRIRYAKR